MALSSERIKIVSPSISSSGGAVGPSAGLVVTCAVVVVIVVGAGDAVVVRVVVGTGVVAGQ